MCHNLKWKNLIFSLCTSLKSIFYIQHIPEISVQFPLYPSLEQIKQHLAMRRLSEAPSIVTPDDLVGYSDTDLVLWAGFGGLDSYFYPIMSLKRLNQTIWEGKKRNSHFCFRLLTTELKPATSPYRFTLRGYKPKRLETRVLTGIQTENNPAVKQGKITLVKSSCFRHQRNDEIWSRKSSFGEQICGFGGLSDPKTLHSDL